MHNYIDMDTNSTDTKQQIANNRFSAEEDISHYTPICYTLTEQESIQTGITCIGGYCRCIDKTKCDCLAKMKLSVNKHNVNIT
jgi:hypothetical protein